MTILVRFGPLTVHRVTVTSTDRPCASCGAALFWILTPRGKAMPVNQEAEADGIRISHFATCPQAPAWRRAKKGGHT